MLEDIKVNVFSITEIVRGN